MSVDRKRAARAAGGRAPGVAGGARVGEETMQLGLLMEAAHAQQALAESAIEALKAHTLDLDAVVREALRHTLMDELQALRAESTSAAEVLRALRRAAGWSIARSSIVSTLACCIAVLALAAWLLPSRAEMAALRARRDALDEQITRLEQLGGRIELRRCGDAQRLCVRVERNAPIFGEQADFFIVKGY